jgi:ribosome biogenesis GTPase
MSALQQGLVISHLGQGIAVETAAGIILCQTLRRLETVTVGDQVLFSQVNAEQQGRIEEILPRRSLLTRPNRGDKVRPVAANIDKIYVVFAPEPYCDFLLIDQYLAICENCNIAAVLVFNKIDLLPPAYIETELAIYQALGYALFRVSAAKTVGIDALKDSLKHQVSIFTGQSGVGKSSLTNALIPDKAVRTNTVSAITKHGRHTTTAATLHHLPEGGDIIDSPGVAIFGLSTLNEAQLAQGYREFQPFLHECKFNNCRHLKDKGCAVRAAAEQGSISMARYQRFLKLREKMPPH